MEVLNQNEGSNKAMFSQDCAKGKRWFGLDFTFFLPKVLNEKKIAM